MRTEMTAYLWQVRPDRALYVFIALRYPSHYHRPQPGCVTQWSKKEETHRAELLRRNSQNSWSLPCMWQESRNIKQILYSNLTVTLNIRNWPAQRFSHLHKCRLGIFPGWLSSMQWPEDSILRLYSLNTQLHRLCQRGREKCRGHWM